MRCQMPFKWTVEMLRILPEAMTIDVCFNFFIKVNQLIIAPWTWLQLKFEEIRWVKQAVYKQNEIENNPVLWN